MTSREEVICDLNVAKIILLNTQTLTPEMSLRIGRVITSAIALLKEQPEIVRCKDCKHATMTSDGKMCKYCAMGTDDFGDLRDVYHDADWFCADGERREDDG